MTKTANIDQYKYSGYDSREFGRNCIIFGADMSSSSHANNGKDNILVLGKDFTPRINGTKIYAEGLKKMNLKENNKRFVLSLNYNGPASYLFVNGTEIHKFEDCSNFHKI